MTTASKPIDSPLQSTSSNTPSHTSANETCSLDGKKPEKKVTRKHCNTLSERYVATTWMVNEVQKSGPKHIISKAVRQFPLFFTGNAKAGLQKASNWWRNREKTLSLNSNGHLPGLHSTAGRSGIKRASLKALPGRGRRRAKWVSALYIDLLHEFERLSSVGVQFSPPILRCLAQHLMKTADVGIEYHWSNTCNEKQIIEKVTSRWIQQFMETYNIVHRCRQSRRLMTTPTKKEEIEKYVAYHLGVIKP